MGKRSRRSNQHVTPHSDGWAIKAEGASRATAIYRTQKEAIRNAVKIAKNQKKDVFIHGKNGRIRDRDSYGPDSCPPRDKVY